MNGKNFRIGIDNPPAEIIDAAVLLDTFFKELNVQNWRVGGCASRAELESVEAKAQKQAGVLLHVEPAPYIRLERGEEDGFRVTSNLFTETLDFKLPVSAHVTIPAGKPERPAFYVRDHVTNAPV